MHPLKRIVFAGAILLSPDPSLRGADYELIFDGKVGEQRLLAASVTEVHDLESLRKLADRPRLTLVIYENYTKVASTRPLALFTDGEVAVRYDRPERSERKPTIGDLIHQANVAGGKRLGATCRDGSRSPTRGSTEVARLISSWRGCAGRGGLARWFYTSVPDRKAIVASICEDYRLVAGKGDQCARPSRVLARIRNRKY